MILRAEMHTHHLQTLFILTQQGQVTLTQDQEEVLGSLYRHLCPRGETESSETVDPALRSLELRKKPKPQTNNTIRL